MRGRRWIRCHGRSATRRASAGTTVVVSLVALGSLHCEPTLIDAIVATDAAAVDTPGCPNGQQRCAGACVSVATDPDHCGRCGHECEPNEVCSLGACDDECAGSLQSCDGACVDLESDDEHCGACGEPCLGAASCTDGECVCPGHGTYCSGACVNTASSHENCGQCGRACEGGQICVEGSCQ